MTLLLTTFIVIALAMAGMGAGVLLGRTREVRRGCGRECECVRRGKTTAEQRQ